jgi:hypothetical protein
VAKHLCGFDLLRLSSTCRWFRRLLADDSIWHYAFFRDLNLSDANPRAHHPLCRSWRYLYFAAFSKRSTKYPLPVTRFVSLTDSRSRLLTFVLPLFTDGSHAFSFCQNGEHRSERQSEITGFFYVPISPLPRARCDASSVYAYLTSARCRFVADRVVCAGHAEHGADREAAAAEVAAVGSRRCAAHHRDTGRLQAP